MFLNDTNTEAAPAYTVVTVVNVRLMHERRIGALNVSEFIRVDHMLPTANTPAR
jgi:hypothetical protein